MKIATWNVERLKHKRSLGSIMSYCDQDDIDILVLTETDDQIAPNYQFVAKTPCLAELDSAFYGETENRVSIYTNYKIAQQHPTYDPYTAICVELETERGNLLVYGTIMGIYGNRHPSFIDDVKQQCEDFRRLTAEGKPLCICGDFNLSFSDNYYFTKAGRSAILETFQDCGIEIVTSDLPESIDHIAISSTFIEGTVKSDLGWWNEDKNLSDHKGIFVQLEPESTYGDFAKIKAGTVITKDDGTTVDIPETIYAIAREPVPNISAEQFRHQIADNLSDTDLAGVLATVWNETGWLFDEISEDGCPQELKERYQGWVELKKSLVAQVGERIGQAPPEKGWYGFLVPFMEQNGYHAATGWWISKSELF